MRGRNSKPKNLWSIVSSARLYSNSLQEPVEVVVRKQEFSSKYSSELEKRTNLEASLTIRQFKAVLLTHLHGRGTQPPIVQWTIGAIASASLIYCTVSFEARDFHQPHATITIIPINLSKISKFYYSMMFIVKSTDFCTRVKGSFFVKSEVSTHSF